MKQNPETHDYTGPGYWGRTISVTKVDGHKISGNIFGSGIHKGDYVLLRGEKPGSSTRYRFTKLKRYTDPGDMYHYEAQFAPRQA